MSIFQKSKLKIIPVGGTTTVQKNLYVYESGNDIVIIDCGIGFPDIDTPGVDITIPDFTYVLDNREKVRGVVITHGHEDHRGAIPYLLQQHKFDVYAVPFVKGLIEKSLEEYSNLKDFRVKVFDPSQSIQLGVFRIHPFRVNHSIPDTLGFVIDTPQGRIFHVSDFKFDWSPVMDKPFDIQKASSLAKEPKEGVLALLSDCLGATTQGFTQSENLIQNTFETVLEKSVNKQVFVTTISSNISRIQQAIYAAQKYDRKVVLSGRSIKNTMSVAQEIGYIKTSKSDFFVDEQNVSDYPQDKLLYVVTGCYGQKGSGLWRLVEGSHKNISFDKNAVVVFSADPIPNTIVSVNKIIDELYTQGIEVYHSEIQEDLHVSGHGGQGDISLLANIVRPKYFIPIGGTIRHMHAYARLIEDVGFAKKQVLQLPDGQGIIFDNKTIQFGKKLKLKEVYVDGNLVGDIGEKVLKERIQMANHGMLVAIIQGNNVTITTKGFIFVKGSKKLLSDTKNFVQKSLTELHKEKLKQNALESRLKAKLRRFLYKQTGRNPLTIVLLSPNAKS